MFLVSKPEAFKCFQGQPCPLRLPACQQVLRRGMWNWMKLCVHPPLIIFPSCHPSISLFSFVPFIHLPFLPVGCTDGPHAVVEALE